MKDLLPHHIRDFNQKVENVHLQQPDVHFKIAVIEALKAARVVINIVAERVPNTRLSDIIDSQERTG